MQSDYIGFELGRVKHNRLCFGFLQTPQIRSTSNRKECLIRNINLKNISHRHSRSPDNAEFVISRSCFAEDDK